MQKKQRIKKIIFAAVSSILMICTLVIPSFASDVGVGDSPAGGTYWNDYENPVNAWEFSPKSKVANYESAMRMHDYFVMLEQNGYFLGRSVLATGLFFTSGTSLTSTSATVCYGVLLGSTYSTNNNDQKPAYYIETSGSSQNNNQWRLTFYAYDIDGKQLAISNTATGTTGSGINRVTTAWKLQESGSVFESAINMMHTTTSTAAGYISNIQAYDFYALSWKSENGWQFASKESWKAGADEPTGVAPITDEFVRCAEILTTREINSNISYYLDIPSVMNAIFGVPGTIFGMLTEIEVFGINIGGLLIALIVLAVVSFITWLILKN